MIPFDIEYARAETAEDAVALYQEAIAEGRSVQYLGGGTELVTMARDGKLTYDVLIDLNRIPETTVLDEDNLSFGSCLRLSTLSDLADQQGHTGSGAIGLIASAVRGIADRTTRNSITLGGNICGMLPYREAVLPFLALDGQLEVAGPDGRRRVPLADVFDRRVKLARGEFVLSLHLSERARNAAYFLRRRTRDARVDYPLVTICMARMETEYRLAITGALSAPVREIAVEQVLNAGLESGSESIAVAEEAAGAFSASPREDMRASADYRRMLLVHSISEGLSELGARE